MHSADMHENRFSFFYFIFVATHFLNNAKQIAVSPAILHSI